METVIEHEAVEVEVDQEDFIRVVAGRVASRAWAKFIDLNDPEFPRKMTITVVINDGDAT